MSRNPIARSFGAGINQHRVIPSKRPAAPTVAEFDYGISADDYVEDDAAIDRWHDGWFSGYRGQPCPADDPDTKSGYNEGCARRDVRVVEPARPEGYYHMPLGTFD